MKWQSKVSDLTPGLRSSWRALGMQTFKPNTTVEAYPEHVSKTLENMCNSFIGGRVCFCGSAKMRTLYVKRWISKTLWSTRAQTGICDKYFRDAVVDGKP
jgi:hypothetical protein